MSPAIEVFCHWLIIERDAFGVDVMALSRDLGHSSPSFTLNRYGHVFEQHRARSAPTLDKLLGMDEQNTKATNNSTNPLSGMVGNDNW